MSNYDFNSSIKDATEYTQKINREFAENLGLDPKNCVNSEYELANSHCIYPVDDIIIRDEDGEEVWNLEKYSFFKYDEAPDTVNPSLWINGKSNYLAGVFEVVKGAIYQVRGFDIANLTIIRSKNGWIVQDVMTSVDTSRAALELLEKALGEPVKDKIRAVIISHSHADHFGGIKGVVKEEQVGPAEEGKIPIYVPAGFDIECVRENIFAGPAMSRRSKYQFGGSIEKGPRGLVSTGLGFAIPIGTTSFISPTNYIAENSTVVIDGITVEFQLTPGTEAPAEMNNYFADYRAFWVAENCNGTLHNLYPIRGAQLRDSSAWADYILEAAEKFAYRSDVIFQSHNWPHFNTKENPDTIRDYLIGNAAIYKYIHDQTLLYANKGYTAKEIAARIQIPEGLKYNWYARPYYGSLQINSRAVYTKYLGFYNGIPTDIDPLTEVEDAKLFVEYAGGEDAVLEKAVEDFKEGRYKNAANAAQRVVFYNPANRRARQLTADAYEQLGYVAESGIWRNAYLQGAYELRLEQKEKEKYRIQKGNDLTICMTTDLLIKYIGILLDYDKISKENLSFKLTVTDGNGRNNDNQPLNFNVILYNGILLSYPSDSFETDNYVITPRAGLLALGGKKLDLVKDYIKTDIYDKLLIIQDAITDVAEFAGFNLIEP